MAGRIGTGMHSRRTALKLGIGAIAACAPVGSGRSAGPEEVPPPKLTEDGLYTQPWFLESFLDLTEDLETAAAEGKHFAVMWELKGCPYCKETHFTNFADPEINTFVRDNFVILQLNLIGSRRVTDFDGEERSEKEIAEKYGVRFTPTFQFFPETAQGLAEKSGAAREIARMPGYFRPEDFLAMFRYVRSGAVKTEDFRSFLKRNA